MEAFETRCDELGNVTEADESCANFKDSKPCFEDINEIFE